MSGKYAKYESKGTLFGMAFWEAWTDVRDKPAFHEVPGMGIGTTPEARRWAAMGRFMDTPHGRAAMLVAWLGENRTKQGAASFKGSSLGGYMRKSAAAPATARALQEMYSILDKDPRRNVKRAAAIVARRHGEMSAAAVRGAWYRHLREKRVTAPPM